RHLTPSERDALEALVVGEAVDVGVYQDEPTTGIPSSVALHQFVHGITHQVLTYLGLEGDRRVAAASAIVGEAVVKALAVSDGFEVRYGKSPKYTHHVEVDLAAAQPQPTETRAQVTGTALEPGEQQ